MKFLYLCFLVCLYAGVSANGVSDAELKSAAGNSAFIRIASYNVEFSKSTTPEQVGKMFKPFKLDLIGFNEVPDGEWTARVGKVLGMHHCYVGKISSAHHKDKYKSILSRTPLVNMQEFPLEVEKGWNPASVVRVETTVNGITLAFYALHICRSAVGDGHSKLLVEKILPQDKMSRIVLAGDFNSCLGNPDMNTIKRSGMRSAWCDLKIDLKSNFTYNALDT